MVVAISEKRCGCYAHRSKNNYYNEVPDVFLTLLINAKTLDIKKNLTLGDEMPKVMWATMGKLVPQLPRIVTFAYDLRFRRVIAHWKGIFEKYTLCHQTLTMSTL
jgi:hypothetical protein